MALSLQQEADTIEDLARRDYSAARKRLGAILDRVKRLEGDERDFAMQFNARLVESLRERKVMICDYSTPDWNYTFPE